MNAVIGRISKSKLSGINNEAEFDVMYSTGFLSIDYLNGTRVYVRSEKRNFCYNSVGIVDGSTNTFIGRPGSGKSTLCNQIISKIVAPFIEKEMPIVVFHDDIEGSLPMSRKEFLLGFPPDVLKKYFRFRNTGITSENMFERIKELHAEKIKNRKQYTYDTGLYDTYGNRIYKFIPSIYFVDSLPMLLPENLANDDELGGSMDASSIAKTNTMMFKKISQLCKEANIIFFTINHILDDIQMGFIRKPAQISGLKDGERLPGGKAAQYLANNMFRVDDSKTLKPDKDYGIDGSVITLTLVKSRTNISKRNIPLIFNKTDGKFDEILSLHYLIKEAGRIQGTGNYSYLSGAPDVKFGAKNFKEVLESSPELQQAFAKECYDVLNPLLSETKNKDLKLDSLINSITNIFNTFGQPQDMELAPV